MSYEAPYEGLKVVDISQGIAGPYAAMLLAQYGAEVVKVEPLEGDWSRSLGRRYGDQTAFSIAGNLGKRSVAVDLKSEEGREIVYRLIEDADVFIEGFRPGVTARLGFGYEEISRRNPRILYLAVSGFGQKGPLSTRPGMDPVLQAFTGMLDANKGEDGIPHRVPIIPIDMATALYGFQAVCTALYARRNEAQGRYIDANLLQSSASLQIVRMMATYLEKGEMEVSRVPTGVFPTKDGWINLVILREPQFATLCEALEIPEIAADPRYATNADRMKCPDEVNGIVNEALSKRTSDEWCERLSAAGLLHEKVRDYAEFLAHPHVEALGAVSWLDQPGVAEPVPFPNAPGLTPPEKGTARGTSPGLGEHTNDVLGEIGLSAERVADLVARKVVLGGKELAAAS